MRVRLQFVLPLLVLTASLSAQTLTIEPLQPTSEDEVAVVVKSIWRDRCPPVDPQVTVQDSEVRIDFRTSGGNCRGYETWEHRVHVGYLDADLYRVRIYIDGGVYEETTLRVEPHQPVFAIHRPAAPEAGGIEVSIFAPLNFCFAPVCGPIRDVRWSACNERPPGKP